MSEAFQLFKVDNLKLVLVTPSRLVYSNAGDKDLAVCYSITKGYIEARGTKAINLFKLYISRLADIREVGSIDKVLMRDGSTVYRLRIDFLNLVGLLSCLGKAGVPLEVARDFKITREHLVNLDLGDVVLLDNYFLKQDINLFSGDTLNWLTTCLLLQLGILCSIKNVELRCYDISRLKTYDGVLYRSPFLCGSYPNSFRKSSIVLFNLDRGETSLYEKGYKLFDNLEKLGDNKYCVRNRIVNSLNSYYMYGFTRRNIYMDSKLASGGTQREEMG